ncbi:hypothetical protein GCM10010289_59620 [Streptomyces violascens]|nr:hypothetical protein GCM10010289_59620 [Streptomyces violascens]
MAAQSLAADWSGESFTLRSSSKVGTGPLPIRGVTAVVIVVPEAPGFTQIPPPAHP